MKRVETPHDDQCHAALGGASAPVAVGSCTATATATATAATRLTYLDGHRGLAILLVIGFHAYARWPEMLPYGDRFGGFELFAYGWIGVQLFFLISGFVILMTLEKCASGRDFLSRRWLRLFPAMCVCSALIYATSSLFSERPAGIPALSGLLPGLTFTEPQWWRYLLGFTPAPLEGAFWSLFVEFKFYCVAALLYFGLGKVRLIGVLFLLYLVAVLVHLSHLTFPGRLLSSADNLLVHHLSLLYFGWFAAGAAYYEFTQSHDWRWFHLATSMGLVSALFVGDLASGPATAAFCVVMLFAVSVVSAQFQRGLSNPVLLRLGFISYPLYLLHENMMISLIVKLGKAVPGIPAALLPVLPILFIALLASGICLYVEKPLTSMIKRLKVPSPA